MEFVKNVVMIKLCMRINAGVMIYHVSIKDQMDFVYSV